jgi:hypothetical protein
MKSMTRGAVLVGLLALIASGCGYKLEAPKASESDVDKISKEIRPTKSYGPAGKVVQSFFKNWEYKRYKQMCAQTVHSREEDVFIKHMRGTPIHCRNMEILSEKPSDDGYTVDVSIEVTDLKSGFAACIINAKYPGGKDSELPPFRLSPEFLGIQRFMTVQQTWSVVSLDGEYFIDVGAAGSKGKRHSNVMNYVLDAAELDNLAEGPGISDEERIAGTVATWLATASLNMDIPKDDTVEIMVGAKPLYKKAEANLDDLVRRSRALHKSDDKNGI